MIIQGHAKRLVIDAPAKINLYLEVLGRRADDTMNSIHHDERVPL